MLSSTKTLGPSPECSRSPNNNCLQNMAWFSSSRSLTTLHSEQSRNTNNQYVGSIVGNRSPHGEPIRPHFSHTFGLPASLLALSQAPAKTGRPAERL